MDTLKIKDKLSKEDIEKLWENREEIVLDEKSWNRFIEILENPPEPSEKLKELLRRNKNNSQSEGS